jgi:succinate dehydrogenase/fumarate reductase flavoprotein subunit
MGKGAAAQVNAGSIFYIYTPRWRDNAAGIKALHLLCDAINRKGGSAWLVFSNPSLRHAGVNPEIKTPVLSRKIYKEHKKLGLIMWNHCGMARNEQGLKEGIEKIKALKADFWNNLLVPGEASELNQNLEKAGRVADLIDLGQLMAMDALQRKESCGGHFREEYQDAEGETLRDDENFSFVGAWEYKGDDITKEELHKEELKYEFIKIAARNYK